MTAPGSRSTSHFDDAAELEFGRYVNFLSDYASQVELLLRRLARSVTLDDPRLTPLLGSARNLVDELTRAVDSQDRAERDLPISQLFSFKLYRAVVAGDGQFQDLPDRLTRVLFEQERAEPVQAVEYQQLAGLLDNLNSKLQQQADQAIAG